MKIIIEVRSNRRSTIDKAENLTELETTVEVECTVEEGREMFGDRQSLIDNHIEFYKGLDKE